MRFGRCSIAASSCLTINAAFPVSGLFWLLLVLGKIETQ
jgi:hypothetical protein